VKFAFIQEHLASFAIQAVCDVLEVSRSGYYAWVKRPQSARAKRQEELAQKLYTSRTARFTAARASIRR